MKENKAKDIFEDESNVLSQKDEIIQKADRVLSVIKNINRHGGIVTQLQMAAACIELESFEAYLLDTYNDNVIDKNDFPDLSKLEEYIRIFKNAENDFVNNLYEGTDHAKQREEDFRIVSYLRDIIMEDDISGVYDSDYEYLDSWKCLKTDIDMLCRISHHLIRQIVLGFESIYQGIRNPTNGTNHNAASKKICSPRNNFREYIRDKERTEEVIIKIHRLISNKKNTAAVEIIKEAMWIEWIERPTIPSIKAEFPTITCSPTLISRILKEGERKPQKGGKIDTELLDIIRKKFEQE